MAYTVTNNPWTSQYAVGIGTDNPGGRLEISAPINTHGFKLIDAGGDFSTIYLDSDNNNVMYNVGGTGSPNLQLGVGGSAKLTILGSDGSVGIGTTGPDNALHIYEGASGRAPYTSTGLTVERNDRANIQLLAPDANDSYLFFGDASSAIAGYIGHYGASMSPANLLILQSRGSFSFYSDVVGQGKVGIGTTSPGYKLEVNGTFYSAGSSVAYKENVEDLEIDPSLIHSLRPVSYDYKKEYKDFGYDVSAGKQLGLLSEDVAKTIPELAIMKDGIPKNVDYQKLSVVLLKEVQNLKKDIEELKK